MNVSIIVAMGRNHEIGKDNDLIWHLPADMSFFKSTTRGHVVIMGRKNYESIPEKFRPLPGRTNIVITRKKDYHAPKCKLAHSLRSAIKKARKVEDHEAFIIGGGQIYDQAIKHDLVDVMYITHIDDEFDADVHFPDFNPADWTNEELFHYEKDTKNPHSFTVVKYTRIRDGNS